MKYLNAGNLIPFYDTLDWQRHRQPGQDALPYGLPVSRLRLAPFQVYFDTAVVPETVVFRLVNVVTNETLTLDDALIAVDRHADGFWLTFEGSDLDQTPDCGYWYAWLYVADTDAENTFNRYSEVLRLVNWANYERARLTFNGCSVDGSNLDLSLLDTSLLVGTADTVLVEQRVGASWVGIGTGDVVVTVANADEGEMVRITVESSTGNTLQTEYTFVWDSADPCDTLTFIQSGQNDTLATDLPDLWRVIFTNPKDRGNVLYQNGYTQELFLEVPPIWDVPEVQRETENTVNGEGLAITRTARTVERMKFEAMDLPDYAIHFLNAAAELGTVTLENVTTGEQYPMPNLVFSSRRQGKELNIGIFEFDGRTAYFAGCDEDFSLI